MKKIAIISYAENNSATKSIKRAIESKGYESEVLNPNNLAMLINNRKGYDMLYTKSNKTEIERIYANEFCGIIPRIGTNILYSSTIIDHLNLNLGIFSTQTGEGLRVASNKLLTLQKCSQQGIPTPKTIYANDPSMIDHYIDMVGLPLVAKTLSGSKGNGVLLLDSFISAKSTLQALFKENTSILIQEFLQTNSSDLRGIVLGNKVICAYKRQAQKGDFRANIHKGATAIPVTLTQEEQDLCVKCAKTLNLFTAGIDFVRSDDGFKLIEVNGNYGFHIQDVTGVNIGEHLVDFISSERTVQKQEKIDFPSKNDLLIRFQEDKIDQMIKAIQKQKQTIDSILKNPKFLSYFKMAKDKEVEYIDSNNIDKVMKVESPKDLYDLMLNTFRLKN